MTTMPVTTGATEPTREPANEPEPAPANAPTPEPAPELANEPAPEPADVAPEPAYVEAPTWPQASGPVIYGRTLPQLITQTLQDSAYLFLTFPIALTSFIVLVTGISLAVGLAIIWVGIPIGVATLGIGVGFAALERARLAARGTRLAPIGYRPVRGGGLQAQLARLADPKRWAATLHGILALIVSTFTWSVLVAWWAGALGGLTYWFWERWLPAGNTGLAWLLDLPLSEAQLNMLLGAGFLVTMPPVLRACAAMHAVLARLLLTGVSRRALQAQVTDLTARRAAAAAAETASLRRLERDIHDGPQQRLVRLGMDLSAAERRLDSDPDEARRLLAEARAQAAETLAELRALSRGIAPPILADRGLAAALAAVAARSTVPTSVEVAIGDERPAPPIEAAAYFVASEALANVAKHARAGVAVVRVWSAGEADDRVLAVDVTDDGVGGANPAKGHGLAGLMDRVEGLGGLVSVTSPPGGPTTVRATLPWS